MSERNDGNNLTDRLRSLVPLHALRSGTIGLADQAIISGVNFIFMIVAARELGPSAFGLFTLLHMLIGIAESIHVSLITTPFTVLSASRFGDQYRRYTSSVAFVQTVLALGSGAVILVAAVVAALIGMSLTPILLALGFTSVATLTQSFTRRVLYAESRFGAALIQDVVTHGLRFVLLGVLVFTGTVSEASLFLVIGLAFMTGALVGIWQIRQNLSIEFERSIVREHWDFGNWLAASRFASLIPRYITAALLSATLSVSAYGAYRAALQLVHGANVPLEALNSLLRPRLARDARIGPSAVSRTIRPVMLLGGAVLAMFAATLIVLREPLLSFIYGSDYAPYAAILVLLALKPLLDLPANLLSNALLAFGLTRAIFIRTLLGSLCGVGIGGTAVVVFGLPAAGAISVVSGLAAVIWLILAWNQRLKQATSEVEGQKSAESGMAGQ